MPNLVTYFYFLILFLFSGLVTSNEKQNPGTCFLFSLSNFSQKYFFVETDIDKVTTWPKSLKHPNERHEKVNRINLHSSECGKEGGRPFLPFKEYLNINGGTNCTIESDAISSINEWNYFFNVDVEQFSYFIVFLFKRRKRIKLRSFIQIKCQSGKWSCFRNKKKTFL